MRILVIEDNRDISDLLKIGLEAESFAVDVISDGESGSYVARTNEYDLIILDYNLPKKLGSAVCAEIRKAKKATPILLLSIKSEVDKKIELLNSGADDYMTKPFSFEELLARIRALLRRPQEQVQETFKIGHLQIDCKAQEVKVFGKPIYLTKKEFSVLEVLVRNKGSVVSRGKLFEHVWDLEGSPFSNSLESHISNIRKKIGGKKMISNIPGRGYRLVV